MWCFVKIREPIDPVIDACVFHEWPSILSLTAHMDEGWAELIRRDGDLTGPLRLGSNWLYRNPDGGNKARSAYPVDGPAGSSLELTAEQLFGSGRRHRVVLSYDDGLLVTGSNFHYAARSAVQAANDWSVAEWLERDERLFGLVLISTSLPDAAAAEIRRAGRHPKMVGVALGANGLGRPFGHPVYHPIYEAAAELGLPLILQLGSDAMTDQIVPPTGGGLANTYGEYRSLSAHPAMSHLGSFMTEGVFDRFPDLKILIVGTGAAWIPGYLWRLDYWYKNSSLEVPGMTHPPTEYFRRHVRVATYGFEWPAQPQRMVRLLRAMPGLESVILYTSGYPNYDWEDCTLIEARLPDEWRRRVMYENAADFFRWPDDIRVDKGSEPAARDEHSTAQERL